MFKKQDAKIANYDSVETLLGKDFMVDGNINSKSSIRIDGTVKSEIHVQGDLVIGETAVIEGKARANNVHMSGKLTGDLWVDDQLKLTATAKLIGDIEVKKVIIDEGAIFQGNCTMNGQVEGEPNKKED